MHYLNHTSMLTSYGDKISVQLTISAFPRISISLVFKQHMEKMLLFIWLQKLGMTFRKKRCDVNTFSLGKLKSLLIEFYLNMHKTS